MKIFLVSFRWASFRVHGPSAGPAEANGLPEAYGPLYGSPKIYGTRGHCPPYPPFGSPVANSANIKRHDLARREEAEDQNKNVA